MTLRSGYANYHRAPGHFVVKIPDGLDHAIAAPMLCVSILPQSDRLARRLTPRLPFCSCGGVTVYSAYLTFFQSSKPRLTSCVCETGPLKQYGAGTTAKDVGIVGIGGLGHFGLRKSSFYAHVACLVKAATDTYAAVFAKALGANVTAISHSESKKADAEKVRFPSCISALLFDCS